MQHASLPKPARVAELVFKMRHSSFDVITFALYLSGTERTVTRTTQKQKETRNERSDSRGGPLIHKQKAALSPSSTLSKHTGTTQQHTLNAHTHRTVRNQIVCPVSTEPTELQRDTCREPALKTLDATARMRTHAHAHTHTDLHST